MTESSLGGEALLKLHVQEIVQMDRGRVERILERTVGDWSDSDLINVAFKGFCSRL